MGKSKLHSEIEFIFHDESTNETVVLYGEVGGALLPPSHANNTAADAR